MAIHHTTWEQLSTEQREEIGRGVRFIRKIQVLIEEEAQAGRLSQDGAINSLAHCLASVLLTLDDPTKAAARMADLIIETVEVNVQAHTQ
jgi:hypothetical protein